MVVETLELELAPGVDEAAFLEADRRVQTELVPNQSGFLRRTTARGGNGDWLVMVLWRDHADAAAFASAAEGHPAHVAFMDLVDATSLRRRTYTTLD